MRLIAAAAATLAFASPALAQRDFSMVEIKTSEVAPGLYMLEGAGGNIGLSVGVDGAFVIDDQFAPLADKILAAIKAIDARPAEFVVNTHWHGDHTGGNEAFGALGAHIVAHDNVRKRLKEGLKRETSETLPAAEGALPVVTFNDEVSFYWNGRDIRVIHLADAHTDGDAIIHFRDANVIHTGDIYFNGGYPYIDLPSGGDFDGLIAAQEKILSLCDDKTKIIPGHGPLSSKAVMAPYVAMLKDVRARLAALIAKGLTEDQVVKADPLKDLNETWGAGFINGESLTRTVYKSLKK
ncbi:MAG: MBL fold metallo-hydrolase [Parvularculaceae bacterium]|nr:MBL fold metallo-hydrolase [Parvularculaceae bacterium]